MRSESKHVEATIVIKMQIIELHLSGLVFNQNFD